MTNTTLHRPGCADAVAPTGGLIVDCLDVRLLDSRRGPRTLVQNVGFDLAAGTTLGIVGESGSGKSLTAKSIIGLLPKGLVASGSIRLGQRELVGAPERDLRALRGTSISLVMQDPFTMLHPLQTVRATLAESLDPRTRRDRARRDQEIERRLDEVGIQPAIADKRTFELSGGMRQRVGIAAALARDPQLLIADEPTTALDAGTQKEVLALLGRLQRSRGMSLILITHDLNVAFAACDRIMVMYAGTMLESGPSEALKHAPRHPYTRGLLNAAPPLTHVVDRLDAIPGTVPAAHEVLGQCAFASRCDLVVDACRTQRPPLRRLDDGHTSACLRTDQLDTTTPREPRGGDAVIAQPRPATVPLVKVENLSKAYRSTAITGRHRVFHALHDASFEIGEAEAVGLVGESGSGKSTLARCLMGLTTPDTGRIGLGGLDATDFSKLSLQQRRDAYRTVQIVFQDPYSSLNPKLTIGAALEEAVRVRGGHRTEVPGLLEQVGLPGDYAQRWPRALSGGERQRVAIARALALRPRLLICDEPVAALDVSVQAQILELLRSVQSATGMSTLFITHDLAVVRQMTSRVLVCFEGRIVESGATSQVLDDPTHPYTRRLRDAALLGARDAA
ncbi:ABC transporter ATP-binding protein [Catellatospora chokoriensis]|uniref:ABC transporter ATP-binding protein n=1 Tax=Catellatospora chokoriensis TaxID=310353 RepID=A0A8J3NVP5_9ACTN|nr:ABC transporter ATP-binding protein [Catellatospora chokoriensis]GIF94285.1 ABC transporter ATP-binding protein [Catellatospora chokoriensis]